jgi:hypothetical protein
MKKHISDQHRRFIETARELGADEDKERFEEKLGRIATARPAEPLKSRSRSTRKKPKVSE